MTTKSKRKLNIGLAAHHAMAAVGGFYGVYALLTRSDTFGSSETTNLIHIVLAGLRGNLSDLLIRIGATICYILGIVLATLGMRRMKENFRFVALVVDAIICPVLALLPTGMDPVLALYPMFFATAMQWVAYTKAGEFSSATIFSTNNLRQCVAGLTEFFCTRERQHLDRFLVFGGTLLCFHLGVVWGWFAMQLWGVSGIYGCLLLLAVGLITTLLDRGE